MNEYFFVSLSIKNVYLTDYNLEIGQGDGHIKGV